MKPTDISNPEYFHKVVDCQYACPAHTPVPEYIRLIAQQRYTDAYMINWESNVFPGVLGRTCDRPCEPACRRGRVEEEPVAICRLKRVAADLKDEVKDLLPAVPKTRNGRRVALIGAGPAALTVARDLMPLGYSVDIYDENAKPGGFMRSQIPSFRLPESVLDEECGFVLDMGVNQFFNQRVDSMKEVLDKNYDAVVVGTGAPKGRALNLPGCEESGANVHIGIQWLASVAFGHIDTIGQKVLVLGGGNTAMDCCRTARRLGGEDVIVTVRSTYEDMKASPWEKEDAMREDIPFECNLRPLEFVHKDGTLVGMNFDRVESIYDEQGKRTLQSTGEDPVFLEADDVIVAVGQQTAFPWIEQELGVEFNKWGEPVVDQVTFQSTLPKVFFAGDAAFGPENIITAVAHGQQAAVSVDLFCQGKTLTDRPDPYNSSFSQKMGIHEWSYGNAVTDDARFAVPHLEKEKALASTTAEVELGFDAQTAFDEAERCLNCDVQTVFTTSKCIECDACTDICPTDCITFTQNGDESDLRNRLSGKADNVDQDLYVSSGLPTDRIMVKDENVCLHCGLCAERCPTGAWDMQKFFYATTKAGNRVGEVA